MQRASTLQVVQDFELYSCYHENSCGSRCKKVIDQLPKKDSQKPADNTQKRFSLRGPEKVAVATSGPNSKATLLNSLQLVCLHIERS